MAQAQLGFHWGLQLWLGFFDSRPISSPTQSIQVPTHFCIRAIYPGFWLKFANTAPIPAHSPLLESFLDASQWMEILVAEFLDNLVALLEGLAQAALTTLVLLGLVLTLLLLHSDVLRELRRDTP